MAFDHARNCIYKVKPVREQRNPMKTIALQLSCSISESMAVYRSGEYASAIHTGDLSTRRVDIRNKASSQHGMVMRHIE